MGVRRADLPAGLHALRRVRQALSDGYHRRRRGRLSGDRLCARRMYLLPSLSRWVSDRRPATHGRATGLVAAGGDRRVLSGAAKRRMPGLRRPLSGWCDSLPAAAGRDCATNGRRVGLYGVRRLCRAVSGEGDPCFLTDPLRRACVIPVQQRASGGPCSPVRDVWRSGQWSWPGGPRGAARHER